MKTVPKTIALKKSEILGLEFHSGYKRYYVFGTDPKEMFKEVIRMYNSYAGTKHTVMTFRNLCKEDEMYGFLYKFDISQLMSFDDDCYSMGCRNGIKIGQYI